MAPAFQCGLPWAQNFMTSVPTLPEMRTPLHTPIDTAMVSKPRARQLLPLPAHPETIRKVWKKLSGISDTKLNMMDSHKVHCFGRINAGVLDVKANYLERRFYADTIHLLTQDLTVRDGMNGAMLEEKTQPA